MKKCKSCFRFTENWRDAKKQGFEEIYDGFGSYAKKPRPGIKLHCKGGQVPEGELLYPQRSACKYHQYRWWWNLKIWWSWHFKDGTGFLTGVISTWLTMGWMICCIVASCGGGQEEKGDK